jgi:phospholipid N-methyltransferase
MMNDGPAQPPRSPANRHQKRPPDWLLFFSKFLRHGKAIASFVPSSEYLARAVVRDIDFSRCRVLVELGAGTGPITSELLRHAPSGCRALIIERDADFCDRLRERFPAADIACADAADLERLLAERGIEKVDHFLCGLPLPSFQPAQRDHILEMVHRRLTAEGTFRQLTHMPWVYYRMYRRYFHEVRFQFVLRNLPPAGFYVCRVPRTAPLAQAAARGGVAGAEHG